MKDLHGASISGVDTHAHIFATDLPLTSERRYAPEYDALVETYLAHLDAHGLSHGVLVQPSFLGTDNQYLLEALARYPERLRGIAVVEHTISETQLDALHQAGIVGIRLNLIQKPLADYRAPEWQRFFKALAARGWSVEIQREIDDLASFVPDILAAGVEVVIDHYGRNQGEIDPSNPAHKAFLDLLKDAPIWTKISAPYRCHADLAQSQRSLNALQAAYGHSQRLLWGSDWPHTQFEHQTDYNQQFETLCALLDDATRQQVLIENPKVLFNL
ncbi:amidohydrolase family protein [Marinomonas ostreistagni]|uniref:amidohydrolase family protein n=1 Tax=Marinomonas ostreistagni TaxID=359209 RepID=UPI0019501CD3|nr:amidohydrolase family protein [Marinomonas ostreistagni]MBM6550372.1 amidohydrolase family protein [Marinomonas ostreistagni]